MSYPYKPDAYRSGRMWTEAWDVFIATQLGVAAFLLLLWLRWLRACVCVRNATIAINSYVCEKNVLV